MDQQSNPKKLFMKIKKRKIHCGCRHPQYNFTLTSFLFFLVKSYSYNSKKN